VRQGEVYDFDAGGSRFRVLVVSSDAHNAVRQPWIAPVRHGAHDAPPYLVTLHDTDPLGGCVDLDRMGRGTPAGQALGTITGATMSRVRDAVAMVFEA